MAQKRAESGRSKAVASAKGSKKGFYILIGLAAVAGIATLSYLSSQSRTPKVIALDPNLPPVTSQGYVMGSPSAPLEVVEFGDFECPGCAQFATMTEPDIRAQYVNTGKIRFRYIDYPLHKNSVNASNAAACADEQGKFWEMHDLIFSTQDSWDSRTTSNPDKHLKGLGRRIPGLDGEKLDECIDSRRLVPKIQSHMKLAVAARAPGTPAFIVGSKLVDKISSWAAFKAYVDKELAALDTTKKTTKKP
jgi:protein-disulfide isomerase